MVDVKTWARRTFRKLALGHFIGIETIKVWILRRGRIFSGRRNRSRRSVYHHRKGGGGTGHGGIYTARAQASA